MKVIQKEDDSKTIRTTLLENARELIETNFSEYIVGLKERTELRVIDEFGFVWTITKLKPRCFSINVRGDIWSSTMDCTFEITEWVLPKISKVALNTKRKLI